MAQRPETQAQYLSRSSLQSLIDAVRETGYECVGPQLHDNAIHYKTMTSVAQLPQGVHDTQTPGHYRLMQSDDPRFFTWANGPQSLKPWVFASEETLWHSTRNAENHLEFTAPAPPVRKLAVLGARACDIAALYIQDKHFLQEDFNDPYYASRREHLVIIAVNCTHPAETCFCASTGDGPNADYGYDIALTELAEGYLIQARSQFGTNLLQRLPLTPATSAQLAEAASSFESAIHAQQRRLPSRNLKQALFANLNHAQWDKIAKRCLSCGNCTSVCPTCFCHRETERPDLDGDHSEHLRQWDSCFSAGHSYIHGITIRASTAQRYRQWLTHKLGSWHDQYGRSGCVGCGRCISWCPVGIDITQEVADICKGSIS